MKKLSVAHMVGSIALAGLPLGMIPAASTITVATEGCTPAQVQTVNSVVTDVVNSAQFICIMASDLSQAGPLALACGIVKDISQATPGLLSFIDQLIAQRVSMLAAGYRFEKPTARWIKP